jgi:hypothetical protein
VLRNCKRDNFTNLSALYSQVVIKESGLFQAPIIASIVWVLFLGITLISVMRLGKLFIKSVTIVSMSCAYALSLLGLLLLSKNTALPHLEVFF